jgi:hypothetical protein
MRTGSLDVNKTETRQLINWLLEGSEPAMK